MIWIYDFTHFRAARRAAVAVLDVVSRYWLSTVVSAQESSTQVEVAFTRALIVDGKEHLLDAQLLDELAYGDVPDRDELPVPLALSRPPTSTRRRSVLRYQGPLPGLPPAVPSRAARPQQRDDLLVTGPLDG